MITCQFRPTNNNVVKPYWPCLAVGLQNDRARIELRLSQVFRADVELIVEVDEDAAAIDPDGRVMPLIGIDRHIDLAHDHFAVALE